MEDNSMVFRNVDLGSRGIRQNQIPLKKENWDEEGWYYRRLFDLKNYKLLFC